MLLCRTFTLSPGATCCEKSSPLTSCIDKYICSLPAFKLFHPNIIPAKRHYWFGDSPSACLAQKRVRVVYTDTAISDIAFSTTLKNRAPTLSLLRQGRPHLVITVIVYLVIFALITTMWVSIVEFIGTASNRGNTTRQTLLCKSLHLTQEYR